MPPPNPGLNLPILNMSYKCNIQGIALFNGRKLFYNVVLVSAVQ